MPPFPPDRYPLIPLRVLDRAAVYFEMNHITFYFYLADSSLISGLYRRSPHREEHVQFAAVRGKDTVFQRQAFCAHWESRADVDKLGSEGAFESNSRFFRQFGSGLSAVPREQA